MASHSVALIGLMKGIVYDSHKDVWSNVLDYESDVKKYFAPLGLELYLDKSEGFAFLKQRELEEGDGMPRLIERRPLSFLLTLLCVVVRKYLLENDTAGHAVRAMITRQQILERMKPFMEDTPDEAKQTAKIDAQITRLTEEGFLRPLENEVGTYEIRRIIKAFIDADKIEDILMRLKEHAARKNQNDKE